MSSFNAYDIWSSNIVSEEDEQIQQIEPSNSVNKSVKLPNPFQKEGATEEDSSAAHDGRVRTFVHERGIWASYVYIYWPRTETIQALQTQLISLFTARTNDTTEFHPFEELHLSLTRTIVLRHHWIDEFVRSVQNSLKNVQRFWVPLNSIRIYCNDNRTRTFISLALDKTESSVQNNLCDIVKRLDGCLNEFNLPPFYEEASFHVSLLWCLGDRKPFLESLLSECAHSLEQLSAAESSEFRLYINQLNVKIGNKLFNFYLK